MRSARAAASAVFLLHGLASGTWVSRIPAVQETLALGEGTLGLALLGGGLGSLLSMVPAGALIARHGSRTIGYWAAVPSAAALALLGLAGTGPALFAALVLFGASFGALDVAMNAQGSAVEGRGGRPVMSSLHGLWSLGNMAGAAVGAALAAQDVPARTHLVGAAPVVLIGLFVGLRPFLTGDHHEAGGGLAWPRGTLLALAAVAFCAVATEGAMFDWAGVYLRRMLGTTEATAALAPSFFSAAMAAGRLGGDHLTASFSAPALARGCALLAAAGLAAVIAAPVPAVVLAGLIGVGLGLSVLVPLAFGAAGRDPSTPTGTAIAAVATMSYVAFLAGPPTLGLIAERLTLRGSFAVLLGLLAVIVLLAPAVGVRRAPTAGPDAAPRQGAG